MSGSILLLPYTPLSCVQEQLVPCSVWLWGFLLRMKLLIELGLVYGFSVWNITFLPPTPLCSRSFSILNFSMGLLPELKFQVFFGFSKAHKWCMSLGRIVSMLSVFIVITVSGKSILVVQILIFQEISTPKLCQCLLSLYLYCFIPNFTNIILCSVHHKSVLL